MEYTKELIEQAVADLTPLAREHKVPLRLLHKPDPMWRQSPESFVLAVLHKAGFDAIDSQIIYEGWPVSQVKAGGGMQFEPTGLQLSKPTHQVRRALELYINRKLLNLETYHVGMKYPTFNTGIFIKKFNLMFMGNHEPLLSQQRREEDPTQKPWIYALYASQDGSMLFSFENGEFGQGGYAGGVFRDKATAYRFIKWLLESEFNQNAVAKMSYYWNTFGGFDSDDWKALVNQIDLPEDFVLNINAL